MRVLVALCVLMIVAVAYGTPVTGDCRYDPWGTCYEFCEEGTHSYDTGCGPLTPEATCEQPHPVEQEGDVCDYSACHCDAPTVRDSVSGKCVPLDKCPKKEKKE